MKNDTFINSKIQLILPYLWFALIVLGVKLLIIANYGNATPFWDQWDAEAVLYRKLLEGNLSWNDLLAPHNEHRIFTTRLFDIAIFCLNGKIWNPILQMQVNAVIHVLALVLLIFYTAKTLSPAYRNTILVFCTVIFSIPFGWESILFGFNVQFYFLLLFSFIFLWAMADYKTYSIKWWLGIIAGILSFLSLASGAITLIAGLITLIFRRYINKEKNAVAISAILIVIALAIAAIILTPTIPRHFPLQAHSIIQFLFGFASIFAWPAHSIIIGGLVIQTPILLLIFYVLYKPEYRTTTLLFLVSIGLWLFGQFAAIAYGRAVGFDASRYSDLFAIGFVANFASLAILLDKAPSTAKLYFSALGGLWIATVLLGFECSAEKLSRELKNKFITGREEEKNVRAYLCTSDFSYLQNKPLLHIPYPDPNLLKSRLDNPTIRSFLPSNIYAPKAPKGKSLCKQYELSCIGNIDFINGNAAPKQFFASDSLEVRGWLAQSPTQRSIPPAFLVLTNNKGKNLFFKTQRMERSDIATRFNNPALNAVGFIATINVSFMPGDYTLGLGFAEGKAIKLCPQFKIRGTVSNE